MKSVGESMAIGRSFEESFQKALRSLEVGILDGNVIRLMNLERESHKKLFRNPTSENSLIKKLCSLEKLILIFKKLQILIYGL